MTINRFCSVVFSLIFITSVNAQVQQEPEETYYVSEEGNLFWQGDLPLYLFASPDPDGKRTNRLESKETGEYTNPMYLDTEGINYIRSKWAFADGKYAIPQKEVVFEVYKDSRPPVTSIAFQNAAKYVNNGSYYYGKGLGVEFSSADALSGVESIYISMDEAPYVKFTSKINLTEDKMYTYRYYSIDHVGNLESPEVSKFHVDLLPPETKFTVLGDQYNNIISGRTVIELSAMDRSAGVKNITYRMNGDSFKNYSKRIGFIRESDGDHELNYFSTDQVGNEESTHSYSFYLDKTAPEIKPSILGEQYQINGKIYVSGASKLKVEATDNKAGVKSISYKIGSGEKVTYSEAFALPVETGNPKVTLYAIDHVNNASQSPFDDNGSGELWVDISAPKVNHRFVGRKFFTRDTLFITSKTTINLSADDDGSGVEKVDYAINRDHKLIYEKPFTIEGEGLFHVDYSATDYVKNQETKTFFVVVDNTGPVIESIPSMEAIGSINLDDFENALPVYTSNTKFYLGATDGVTDTRTIYYKLNEGRELVYNKQLILTKKGVNVIEIRAVDMLNNETIQAPITVFIN